jgi:hypothetical protein
LIESTTWRRSCQWVDQVPVDRVAEQIIDVLVTGLFGCTEEAQIFPIADARHELDAEQMVEAEYRR